MRILVIQKNYTIGDFAGNTAKIIEALKSARKQQIDCVLFSELAICGYPPEDFLLQESFVTAIETHLEKIIKESSDLFVVIGTVRKNLGKGEKSLCNSAAIICNGKLLGYHDKNLLPTYDVFDERRYFEPGFSCPVWEHKNKKIAVTICEDIWQHSGFLADADYLQDPIAELIKQKPDVVFNLSASPYQMLKLNTRMQVCTKAASSLQCPLLMCCQVGGNDQLIFDGYSMCVNEGGQVSHLAKGFEEDEMVVDIEKLPPISIKQIDPCHELYSALVLGVRDYFYKSGYQKGCLGLSGGVDSALVACIAKDALGAGNVYAIGMPSRYSSTSSVEDARVLAQSLQIQYEEISIENPFCAFLDLLEPFFKGKDPDITEENLQSRIRGMILMAFSNKFSRLVLSTGNKSELALGYCTLYGDMCGGLSVISDVTKTQVYKLAYWLHETRGLIPQSTLEKAPSAELKLNQKDSDSLPDYDTIDCVLQSYVEESMSAEQIIEKYHLPSEVVLDLIQRIHKAEYKRRQSPPGIRVSKKAFHVGRKYPIVQKWVL